MSTTEENHRKFLAHLEASRDGVWLVARWLQVQGFQTTVMPFTKAPTRAEWKQHADNGDLFINQRIEVKQLGYSFTSALDWPFGSRFFVVNKNAFDRAKPRPYAFFSLNKEADHAAFVMASTRRHWCVEKTKDRRYDEYEQDTYLCPMEHVSFVKLIQGDES
jgi:hypothetical protein